jgi:hypothetical protein
MTAKKSTALKPQRYNRKEQIVEVLEGATVLLHTGDAPAGVARGTDQELLFMGERITDSSYLLYDELGTPLFLMRQDDFKALYESTFEGGQSNTALKIEVADCKAFIKELEKTALEQNETIDGLRADKTHLKNLIERIAAGLKLKIEDFASEEEFVAAVSVAKTGDSAMHVLRDILRIEAAQQRDDGGRIIQLNKKIIDRASAIL